MKKILIFLAVVSVVLVGFYLKTSQVKIVKMNQEIGLALTSPVKTFDPAKAFDDDSLSLISQSLESLYQYHYLKRPYEVIPALADGLPLISDNGKVYTIKIKKGIKYHNRTKFFKVNKEVTAHDFEMQFKRIAFKGTKSLGTWLFSGKIKGFDEFSNKAGFDLKKLYSMNIEGVEVIDNYTLRIELIRPEPNLLFFLSMSFLSPTPKALVEHYKNDLSKVLVGTGPYYLKKNMDSSYIFLKNNHFRKELYPSSGDRYANTQKLLDSTDKVVPFVEKIKFKVLSSDKEKWDAFMNKEVDILSVPKKYLDVVSNSDKKFEELKLKNDFSVKYFSTISSRWLAFNMKDKLLGTNLKLRQAIAHAIDFDEYISILTNSTNLKANSIYNPSIPGYLPSNELPYRYNVEKAKKLMAESKLKNITLTYSTRGLQKIYEVEGALLKKYLARIGINLKIEMLTFSDFLKKGRAGKLQFFTDNWIYDYPDAENNIQLLTTKNSPGINKSGYSSNEIDSLYNKLTETLDLEERFKIMKEVETEVNKDLPWIMLMYDSSYVLHSNKIRNFRKSFFIRNYVKYIEVY